MDPFRPKPNTERERDRRHPAVVEADDKLDALKRGYRDAVREIDKNLRVADADTGGTQKSGREADALRRQYFSFR